MHAIVDNDYYPDEGNFSRSHFVGGAIIRRSGAELPPRGTYYSSGGAPFFRRDHSSSTGRASRLIANLAVAFMLDFMLVTRLLCPSPLLVFWSVASTVCPCGHTLSP